MNGWIYVLELAPTACVKVGQTMDLPQRLAAHIGNATMYGFQIKRIATFLTVNPERVETDLLAELRAQPQVRSIQGRETFTGITFNAVTRVARRVVARQVDTDSPAAAEDATVGLDHLAIIREQLRQPREQLRDVLPRLREQDPAYRAWTQTRLAEELTGIWGVPVGYSTGYRTVLAADVEHALKRRDEDLAGAADAPSLRGEGGG